MIISHGQREIKPLSEDPLQAVVTNLLQVTDIMQLMLSELEGGEIIISTFSVSEELLRRLFRLKKKIDITKLTLVVDYKAMNKTVQLWRFIDQIFDEVYMCDNHSKSISVKSDKGCATLITSQNLTRGNRYEAHVLTSYPAIYDNIVCDIKNIIKYRSIPLHDVLAGRISTS